MKRLVYSKTREQIEDVRALNFIHGHFYTVRCYAKWPKALFANSAAVFPLPVQVSLHIQKRSSSAVKDRLWYCHVDFAHQRAGILNPEGADGAMLPAGALDSWLRAGYIRGQ